MPARKYHLIGIGDDQMAALAIALKASGHQVTGSDESISPQIAEKLGNEGLKAFDHWAVNGMTQDDVAVFFQSLPSNNQVLQQAKKLGCQTITVSQLIEQMTTDQQRIVVTGSLRSMITDIALFVLKAYGRKFDHYVATQNALDTKVVLRGNPIIVVEGGDHEGPLTDYQQHIGIISGGQNEKEIEAFAAASPKGGTLIYNADDPIASRVGSKERADVNLIPFTLPKHELREGKAVLTEPKEAVLIQLKGDDQLRSAAAARELLKRIGITSDQFFNAIGDYLP